MQKSREIVKGTGRRDRVRDVGKQREGEGSGKQRELVRGAGLQRASEGEDGGLWWIHWIQSQTHM